MSGRKTNSKKCRTIILTIAFLFVIVKSANETLLAIQFGSNHSSAIFETRRVNITDRQKSSRCTIVMFFF